MAVNNLCSTVRYMIQGDHPPCCFYPSSCWLINFPDFLFTGSLLSLFYSRGTSDIPLEDGKLRGRKWETANTNLVHHNWQLAEVQLYNPHRVCTSEGHFHLHAAIRAHLIQPGPAEIQISHGAWTCVWYSTGARKSCDSYGCCLQIRWVEKV